MTTSNSLAMAAAYSFDPAVHVLGNPCRRGHTHEGTGLCPRFRTTGRKGQVRPGNCVICRAENRPWLSPGIKAGRLARANSAGKGETLQMHRHLRSMAIPTVADLVREEQLRYWLADREAFWAEQYRRRNHRLQYRAMTEPELRAKTRERHSRRRAAKKANHLIRVTASQILERFAEFDHACAYCGALGVQLQVEHFLSISKGGTHVLGNILPACASCNYAKRDQDPEEWYRAQPSFTEQRWRKILRALGKGTGTIHQLTLV